MHFEDYQNNQVEGQVQFVEVKLYRTGHVIASIF